MPEEFDAMKVLADLCQDTEIDAQTRINACVQYIAQKRQEKYDGFEVGVGVYENPALNELKEEVKELRHQVSECLDLFRLISDR
jgi:hypothetical protein